MASHGRLASCQEIVVLWRELSQSMSSDFVATNSNRGEVHQNLPTRLMGSHACVGIGGAVGAGEERLMQVLRAMNRLLDRHPQSRRRHLAWNTPSIIPVWPQVRGAVSVCAWACACACACACTVARACKDAHPCGSVSVCESAWWEALSSPQVICRLNLVGHQRSLAAYGSAAMLLLAPQLASAR